MDLLKHYSTGPSSLFSAESPKNNNNNNNNNVADEKFARKLQLKLSNIKQNDLKMKTSSESSESSSSSDSDFYYDFGVSSPIESPTQDFVNNIEGVESGCVLSTPQLVEDGSSEASDNSVYYDVETGSLCSSPKNTFLFPDILDTPIKEQVKVEENVKVVVDVDEEDKSESDGGKGTEIDSEEDDDEYLRRPLHRIQRSSSLKTGKTPPGTPGRKKIVRFADVLGLDLTDVRTFLDEIPNVPKSAFVDLKDALENAAAVAAAAQAISQKQKLNKTLLPSFHQPVTMPDFFDKIRDQKVLLENAFLIENFTVKGTVRVKNMDFHKSVYIRFTYNDWKTFVDFQASYVNGSCDGFSDRFEFTFPLCSESVSVGGRVSFACRFHCQGQQFWDNNCGRNYIFHCVPSTSQISQDVVNPYFYNQPQRMWM